MPLRWQPSTHTSAPTREGASTPPPTPACGAVRDRGPTCRPPPTLASRPLPTQDSRLAVPLLAGLCHRSHPPPDMVTRSLPIHLPPGSAFYSLPRTSIRCQQVCANAPRHPPPLQSIIRFTRVACDLNQSPGSHTNPSPLRAPLPSCLCHCPPW